MASPDDCRKRPQLLGLVARGHRDVRVVPVAHHAEALEVRALEVNLAGRVLAAGLAEGVGVQLLSDAPVFLFDLLFDRQAMAVPAGYVRRVVAVERPGLDD